MNDILTILPNKGVGDLKLGSSKQEVIAYFGNADETTINTCNGVEVLRWKKGIECVFLQEMNWRLNSISLAHSDAVLADQKVIGQSQDEIITSLADDFGKPELSDQSEKVDEETFWMADYDQVGMSLWFENGSLSAVSVCANTWDRRDGTPILN